MGTQEHSWRHAQILTQHRALCSVIAALPKAEICRILGENMQNTSCSAAGPKELGKLGVLKPVVFCSFCFTKTNPPVSSQTSALYSPDCHTKLCWKLLLLQSPIGGHHSFTQGSKARKHVIKHRNTALSRINKGLFKCKQTALTWQGHYYTFKRVLQSAAFHLPIH